MTNEPTTNSSNISMSETPTPQPRSSAAKVLQIIVLGAIVAFVGIGAFLLTSAPPSKKHGPKVMAYRNERPPAYVKYVDGLVINSLSRTTISSVMGLTMLVRDTRPRIESARLTSTFSPR